MGYFLGFLLFTGLFVAVVALWSRLQRIERQLEAVIDQSRDKFRSLEAQLTQASSDRVPATARETMARPATPLTAPLSKAETEEPRASASEVETEAQPPQAEPLSPTEAVVEEPTPAPPSERIEEPETIAYSEPPTPTLTAPARPDIGVEAEPPETEAPVEHAATGFDFEDIFGRRLPIWAGGIALAIAGIFLVRYAIEAGFFTPAIRVSASFLFGVGLIAGAELAYREKAKIADPRVRQALAGAGIATLFGAFYLAGTGYGLIGPVTAFLGLAAVTAGAVGLSFRFGLPCAVLGLVGGFAAPVMVDSESANIPLLALYLGLVTGGLTWTGARQGHHWLGYLALGVGLFWGALMQLAGFHSNADILSLGGYLIVLGTVLPAFLYQRKEAGRLQIIAGAVATLQMAMLVGRGGVRTVDLGAVPSDRWGTGRTRLVLPWLASDQPDCRVCRLLVAFFVARRLSRQRVRGNRHYGAAVPRNTAGPSVARASEPARHRAGWAGCNRLWHDADLSAGRCPGGAKRERSGSGTGSSGARALSRCGHGHALAA